eukprot:1342556-Prymnesium_polylepis.1
MTSTRLTGTPAGARSPVDLEVERRPPLETQPPGPAARAGYDPTSYSCTSVVATTTYGLYVENYVARFTTISAFSFTFSGSSSWLSMHPPAARDGYVLALASRSRAVYMSIALWTCRGGTHKFCSLPKLMWTKRKQSSMRVPLALRSCHRGARGVRRAGCSRRAERSSGW